MSPELENLRAECNRIIKIINQGSGVDTPGFNVINSLLKACDKVFQKEEPARKSLKELAAMMDGREYRDETNKEIEQALRDSRAIAVFGASDDLIELRGMIDDEAGAADKICITKFGIIDHDDIPLYDRFGAAYNVIWPIWGKGSASWQYDTNIIHETFNIYEDGELYCIGIVFSYDTLPEGVR